MNIKDIRPHTNNNEINATQELLRGQELQRTRELFKQNELTKHSEFQQENRYIPPAKQNNKKQQESKSAMITKYLATITAVATTTAIVVLPIVKNAQISVQNEDISFSSYSCTLIIEDNDQPLEAIIQDTFGETYEIVEIDALDESVNMSFDDLLIDTQYNLSIVDDKGKVIKTHTFATQPIVTFGEIDGNRIPFTLHEDVSEGIEYWACLVADGYEVNNVIIDTDNGNYIVLDGLYEDVYTFRFEYYVFDEETMEFTPIVYEKEMTLGTLTKPTFNATFEPAIDDTTAGRYVIQYESGDISIYTAFEVEVNNLSNVLASEYMTGDMVYIDGNNIYATAQFGLEEGDYEITLWGSFEIDGYTITNIIWRGVLQQ